LIENKKMKEKVSRLRENTVHVDFAEILKYTFCIGLEGV